MAGKFINVRGGLVGEISAFVNSLAREGEEDDFGSPPAADQRGRLARTIDHISVRLLVFLVAGVAASFFFALPTSAGIAVLVTALAHLGLNRERKRRVGRERQRGREFVARRHTYEQLMKMEDREFTLFMTQVFNGLKGFSGMHPVSDNGDVEKEIDIRGRFKDVPVAANCRRYPAEREVTRAELVNFTTAMKKCGLQRGIYITTSHFSDRVIDYVRSIRSEARVVLVDRSKLVEWVRLSGHSIYPDEQQVCQLEAAAKQQAAIVTLKKKETRNRRLMHSFLLVTAYLTFLGFIMQRWLAEWMLMLYFALAVANFGLGMVFYYLYRHVQELIGEASALDQFD